MPACSFRKFNNIDVQHLSARTVPSWSIGYWLEIFSCHRTYFPPTPNSSFSVRLIASLADAANTIGPKYLDVYVLMNTYIYGGAPSYSGKYWAMPISPTSAPVWICLPVLICRKICRRAISLFSSQVCMYRIDTRIYRSPSSHRVELSDTSNPVPFSSCVV